MRNLANGMRSSCYFVGEGVSSCIMFRDKSIKHDFPYDLRAFFNNDNSFLLEVTNWSKNLFDEFNKLLSKDFYEIVDVDCDAIISLKKVFRQP